jgi:NTE family protein
MTVAFALSGGGNLGPMQAGTLLALIEGGIEPDFLVGSSVGALNAAFLACRPGEAGPRLLVDSWSALRRQEAVQLNPLWALAGFLGLRDHLLSPTRLRRLIRRWIEVDRVEETRVPLAITATDALSGECVVLTAGDIVDALAASAAIPGLFPAVFSNGRWLIDGSLSANQPVRQAQSLGADEVFVITTATAPRTRPPRGAVAMAMSSVSLVTSRLGQSDWSDALRHARATGGHVRMVPSAAPHAPGPFEYRRGAELAEASYRRTREWLAAGCPDETRAVLTGAPASPPGGCRHDPRARHPLARENELRWTKSSTSRRTRGVEEAGLNG